MALTSWLVGMLAAAAGGIAPVGASCPSAAEILERLGSVEMGLASRTSRFASAPPTALYDKAAAAVGRPYADKDHGNGLGVIVTPLPVELLWKAVGDEDHHALEDRYLPLRHSEVIEGTPGGPTRLVFQYFRRMGFGRWWVNRVTVDRELFERSGGTMWEVTWEDVTERIDPARPPLNEVSSRIPPLRRCFGAWLLVPLGETCTLVELFSGAEPGGFAGAARRLLLERAVRDSLEGLVCLAEDHGRLPHPGTRFTRPDGSALEFPAAGDGVGATPPHR